MPDDEIGVVLALLANTVMGQRLAQLTKTYLN